MRRPRGTDRDTQPETELEVIAERVDRLYHTEGAFVHFYGKARNSFWLDSSKAPTSARGSRSWPPAVRTAP